MRILGTAPAVLLALPLLVFGGNYFLHFVEMPSGDEAGVQQREYYQGEVEAKWLRACLHGVRYYVPDADAIVIGTPVRSEGKERERTEYVVHRVIAGADILRPHIKSKDSDGKGAAYIVVEYESPKKKPNGATVLFLDVPTKQGATLTIHGPAEIVGDERVYYYLGMMHATKDIVEAVEDAVRRLQDLLAFFKSDGFPLRKPPGDAFIIAQEKDAWCTTGFIVFPRDEADNAIREYLLDRNRRSEYNPHCKIAMWWPGLTFAPSAGAEAGKTLGKHTGEDSRILSLFRTYRPKRPLEKTPKTKQKANAATDDDSHVRAIRVDNLPPGARSDGVGVRRHEPLIQLLQLEPLFRNRVLEALVETGPPARALPKIRDS